MKYIYQDRHFFRMAPQDQSTLYHTRMGPPYRLQQVLRLLPANRSLYDKEHQSEIDGHQSFELFRQSSEKSSTTYTRGRFGR